MQNETEEQAQSPIHLTQRGFGVYEFKDSYGESCSLQESSAASDNFIWFGMDKVCIQYMMPGQQGFKRLEPPEGSTSVSDSARMHLNRKQVAVLIPILQRFVETGSIVDESEQQAPSSSPESFDEQKRKENEAYSGD